MSDFDKIVQIQVFASKDMHKDHDIFVLTESGEVWFLSMSTSDIPRSKDWKRIEGPVDRQR